MRSAAAVAVVVGGIGSVLAAPALGDPPPPMPLPPGPYVAIQATYTSDGLPELVANFAPDGSVAKPHWSVCAPPNETVCVPTSIDQSLQPGDVPAGTVFEASVDSGGRHYAARTPPWRGRVHVAAPPTLTGALRVGADAIPHAGTWAGGWGDDADSLAVIACKTRAMTGCFTVFDAGADYPRGPRPNAVIGAYSGAFLFAVDRHLARDTAFAGVGFGKASDVPTPDPGALVAASAPYGPVAGPPAPVVQVLRRAVLKGKRLTVARVRCAGRCKASALVNDPRRGVGYPTRVNINRTGDVTVDARRFSPGVLNVVVAVDLGPGVSGKSRYVVPATRR